MSTPAFWPTGDLAGRLDPFDRHPPGTRSSRARLRLFALADQLAVQAVPPAERGHQRVAEPREADRRLRPAAERDDSSTSSCAARVNSAARAFDMKPSPPCRARPGCRGRSRRRSSPRAVLDADHVVGDVTRMSSAANRPARSLAVSRSAAANTAAVGRPCASSAARHGPPMATTGVGPSPRGAPGHPQARSRARGPLATPRRRWRPRPRRDHPGQAARAVGVRRQDRQIYAPSRPRPARRDRGCERSAGRCSGSEGCRRSLRSCSSARASNGSPQGRVLAGARQVHGDGGTHRAGAEHCDPSHAGRIRAVQWSHAGAERVLAGRGVTAVSTRPS